VVQSYLGEARMATQFWPERVEIVAELPRAASGKIQKFKLRELAAAK
jgi:cyclohexanecarboxylate-CoA ligase